ncbi:MAG: transcription termination factor NusA [Kiritimatiellia bacterium]
MEEIRAFLTYWEKERGVDRETVVQALESALLQASRKSVGPAKNLRIEIDRKTCVIRAIATVKVVEQVANQHDEISLAKALKLQPEVKLGDDIDIDVTPRDFGRIAAQNARQAFTQKLRQAERAMVKEEYKDQIGKIVSGAVRQFERTDVIVDLGRAEALLPKNERIQGEEYQQGDRIRGLLLEVQENTSGPSLILSRAHPNFVRALFELEVAEIADGTIEIRGIAREPGQRTKIAVFSREEKVDPVGACVGMRGMRVKNIVKELSGEKIDIVRWSDDIRTYVSNALSPAKLSKVVIDPERPKVIHVTADTDQLSLAIGKRGQNVRLTAKLTGWKVDIQREEGDISFEEKMARAIERLAQIPGIGKVNAEKLVRAGFLNIEGILAADVAAIQSDAEFDAETAQAVYEAAAMSQLTTEEGGQKQP